MQCFLLGSSHPDYLLRLVTSSTHHLFNNFIGKHSLSHLPLNFSLLQQFLLSLFLSLKPCYCYFTEHWPIDCPKNIHCKANTHGSVSESLRADPAVQLHPSSCLLVHSPAASWCGSRLQSCSITGQELHGHGSPEITGKNKSSPGRWPKPRPLARQAEHCRSLREGQRVTPGHRELPDIHIPGVFHKPRQLLTIVSGEAGPPIALSSHPFPWQETPSSLGTLSQTKVGR